MKLFSWFNPLWLVQNLFTTSLNPITIGAGIGALGSAVQGKSPFKGALLGGALGGAGSALGGALSGATATTAQNAANAAKEGLLGTASGFTEGAANMGNIGMANMFNTGAGTTLGQAGTYAQGLNPQIYTGSQGMFDVAKGSTLGYDPSFLGGQGPATFAGGGGYDPSFLGRINESIGNIGNPFSDLTARDKLGLGLQGVGMLNQPQQQMQTPPVMPITRGNPDMVSSPLMNVAPNVGMQQGNELGLPNLLSRMPLTEEELLKLQQQMQTTGFRGR
jgi:hypothetical protein